MLIPSSLNGNSRLSNEAPEPKASCSYQAASPTLTTNHPSEAGLRPDSACSSFASSGMRPQATAAAPGAPYPAISRTVERYFFGPLPRIKSILAPLLCVVPGLGFSATTLPLCRADENALAIFPTRQ